MLVTAAVAAATVAAAATAAAAAAAGAAAATAATAAAAAAAAAKLAASRMEVKYVKLLKMCHFVSLAFKPLGPIGSKATKFLINLGRRCKFTHTMGNPMETAFMF